VASETILLVDDDTLILQMCQQVLEAAGYTTVCLTEGASLASTVEVVAPSLILLDIMMPGMNGFDVCTRLREMVNVPVLMLTAMVSEGDILHGFHVGADDYVRKPYSIAELDARIRSLLRRQELTPSTK
jgi:DNA-binding response OmpR family regulator